METKNRNLRTFIYGIINAPEKLRVRAPRAYLAGVCGLFIVFVAALFIKYHIDNYQIELPIDRVRKEMGNEYVISIWDTVSFPWILRTTGDGFERPKVSHLQLFENGKPLGPGHSRRLDIRKMGAGRYSHWSDQLYFSSSDNTDPRLNGRTYTAVYALSVRRRVYAALLLFLTFAALPYYQAYSRKISFATWRLFETTASGPRPETRAHGKRNRVLAVARSAGRVAIVIALTLGGIEFGSYLYLKVAEGLPLEKYIPFLHSPYRGHRLKPAGEYAPPDHSPDGFRRDTAVSMEKPPNTMRIFAMGGSQLYGIGAGGDYPVSPSLTNDETIDHQLETMVNDRLAVAGFDKKVEIINAGVVGYHTFQHLVYVNERLAHYHPDFFIFLDGHNDFYSVSEGRNPWLSYPYYSVVISDMINKPTLLYASYLLFKALPQQSSFVVLVHRIFHKRVQIALNDLAQHPCCKGKAYPSDRLKAGYKEYAEISYLRAYRQIRIVADQLGAGMMVFVQPEIALENADDLSRQDRELQKIAVSRKDYQISMRSRHSYILPTFEGTGFEVHDLGTIADKTKSKEQLYIDYTHLSPAGARVVAELMLDKMWPHVMSWVHTGDPKKRWPLN